jgi:hypothetical protein
MTVLTSAGVRRRLATPAQLLLRRRAAVYLPAGAGAGINPEAAAGVDLLETDLVGRGWLLAPALRQALAGLDTAELVGVGAALLADCDALLGADRPHTPLFRDFPASVPNDTMAFFVDRILTVWFQACGQPCVLCERDGTVAPVNQCGHLVCRACFDGADFSACPICHRRIHPGRPVPQAGPAAAAAWRHPAAGAAARPAPRRRPGRRPARRAHRAARPYRGAAAGRRRRLGRHPGVAATHRPVVAAEPGARPRDQGPPAGLAARPARP